MSFVVRVCASFVFVLFLLFVCGMSVIFFWGGEGGRELGLDNLCRN